MVVIKKRGKPKLNGDDLSILRNSRLEVFLGKGVLKIYSKCTEENPYQSAISTLLKLHFGIDVLL